MRFFPLLAMLVAATPAFAVDVLPVGGGQYEIMQETGFSYSQDARQQDAASYCKRRGRQMQVIAAMNSVRFTCVRRG